MNLGIGMKMIFNQKSLVRENAEKDSSYCPYCMRCRGLVRMKKIEEFYWKCKCGAVHDERDTNANT